MKKIFLICILHTQLILAQTQILPLFKPTDRYVTGAYYKDTFNDFDNFTGTWKHTNGATSLTVKLQKVEQYYSATSDRYFDYVIGGYQYIENGVEKINTLHQLTDSNFSLYSYSILGNILNTAADNPACNICDPFQRRLILQFEDPTRAIITGLYGEIILRRVDSGGQQKIEMRLRQVGNITYIEGNPPQFESFNVPWGSYTLIKID